MSSSYFSLIEGISDLKIEPEVMQLNFAHLSPYRDFKTIYKRSQKDLMLWFFPRCEHKALLIPEAYLLFSAALKQSSSGIFIFHAAASKILIISEGRLLSAFTTEATGPLEKMMLQEKHGLSETFEYEEAAQARMLDAELEALNLMALYSWYQPEGNVSDLLKEKAYELILPLSTALFLLVGIEFMHDRYLENAHESLKEHYSEIKLKNDPYRGDAFR